MANPANATSNYERADGDAFEAGCPMLIHAAAPNPVDGSRVFMRCALGWSVFTSLSQARCAATHLVENCWQAHPEKTPLIDEASLLIPISMTHGKIAAD
jgi:hypothetical protein